jgi:hypothetical protein
MPLDEKLLGFSNRWYRPALDSAEERGLEGLRIRTVTGVYFCATKLEAFAGRGKEDHLSSHDLKDLNAVIDGRAEIVREIRSAPVDVRTYIAAKIKQLPGTDAFVDTLPGYLLPDAASQARIKALIARLKEIEAS